MWQASLDTGSDSIRLILTQAAPGSSDPRFVAAREWSSVDRGTIEVQLHRWERDHDIEIKRIICTFEGLRLCPPEWPLTVASSERANLLAGFWQTLTLPEWQRGLALAILSLSAEINLNQYDPERLALAWLIRRIGEVEAFLYGDEEVAWVPSA